MRLSGKKILLGVTGSIAAYKSVSLCRLLKSEGAEVQVIMTPSSAAFITPLTLSVVSGRPVLSEMIADSQTWNNHVELGLWADLLLVAPASAHTMAAFTQGTCENLLQAVYLSARCPVMVAPAMDHDMFLHPATSENLKILAARGHLQVGPVSGALASGLTGEGRLAEPEQILEEVVRFFSKPQPLKGKKILVNAGPTREPIDPVRYITNHSTGKMGVEIASALLDAGAEVYFVSGPLQVPVPQGVHVTEVITAAEMMEACSGIFPGMDGAILTAAVADYRPATTASDKIKKGEENWSLALEKTGDILQHLGQLKTNQQVLAGFALETQNEQEHALQKLRRKNLDFIVLNSLRDEGAGFGTDTNKVTIISKDNSVKEFPLMTKSEVASEIVQYFIHLSHA